MINHGNRPNAHERGVRVDVGRTVGKTHEMAPWDDKPAAFTPQWHGSGTQFFVVLRHDRFHPGDASPEETVYVTNIFTDQAQARHEADRLNDLAERRGADVYYWVQAARLAADVSSGRRGE
jgi:hypothetical protein